MSKNKIIYNIHNNEDGTSTAVIYYGGRVFDPIHNTHPNFDHIVAGVLANDESALDLIDISTAIAEKFRYLSERVAVANGRVYFDGDEIHNALARHLLRVLDEGDQAEWIGLVNFWTKLASNPSEHSREQLFEWLQRFDFTITIDGDILCYKGVNDDLTSCTAGPGIVNGQSYLDANLPNNPGDVVEMARSTVTHDPAIGCSKGLHVAAYKYGSGFGSATVAVLVNPRDVVSVPTECNWEKMRVCRYTVQDVIEQEYTGAVYNPYAAEDEDAEHDYCENCDCCLTCGECDGESCVEEGYCEDCGCDWHNCCC